MEQNLDTNLEKPVPLSFFSETGATIELVSASLNMEDCSPSENCSPDNNPNPCAPTDWCNPDED